MVRGAPPNGSGGAGEESGDRATGLLEGVPENGVSARDGHHLEQVAERLAMWAEELVVWDVRVGGEDEQRRHPHGCERRWLRGHLAVRGDYGGLAVAISPAAVVVLDEVAVQRDGD